MSSPWWIVLNLFTEIASLCSLRALHVASIESQFSGTAWGLQLTTARSLALNSFRLQTFANKIRFHGNCRKNAATMRAHMLLRAVVQMSERCRPATATDKGKHSRKAHYRVKLHSTIFLILRNHSLRHNDCHAKREKAQHANANDRYRPNGRRIGVDGVARACRQRPCE